MDRVLKVLQVVGCFLLALLVVATASVNADTIVNNKIIGQKHHPVAGDGIAEGDTAGGDDLNDITNNSSIWAEDYGIYNYSGTVTNNGKISSTAGTAVRFGPYDGSDGGVGDRLYNFGKIMTEDGTAVSMSGGSDRLENYGTIFVNCSA